MKQFFDNLRSGYWREELASRCGPFLAWYNHGNNKHYLKIGVCIVLAVVLLSFHSCESQLELD